MEYTLLKSGGDPSPPELSVDGNSDFAEFKNPEMPVTFHQSKISYAPDEELFIHFSVFSLSFEMKDDHQIGVCRFPDDVFLISKPVSDCEQDFELENLEDAGLLDDNDKIVAKKTSFKADQIPVTEAGADACYQFVYKDSIGQIYGRSTPFQIKNKNFLETTVEDKEKQSDEEFVVVRSHDNYLSDRVEHLTNSVSLLQYLIRNNEKELVDKERENYNLKKQLDNSNNTIDSLNESIRILKESSAEEKASVENDLLKKEKEVKDHMMKLEESNKIISNLKELIGNLQKDLLEKNQELKVTREQFSKQLDSLSSELENKNRECLSLSQDIASLNKDTSRFQDCAKIKRITEENDRLKSELASVLNERRQLREDKQRSMTSEESNEVIINLRQEVKQNLEIIESLQHKAHQESSKDNSIIQELISKIDELNEILARERNANEEKIEELILKNKNLLSTIKGLEDVVENQTQELFKLKTEIKDKNNIIANLSKNGSSNKSNQELLSMNKLNADNIELKARLKQAKVEYASIYGLLMNELKKKTSKSSSETIINLAPSVPTSLSVDSGNNGDSTNANDETPRDDVTPEIEIEENVPQTEVKELIVEASEAPQILAVPEKKPTIVQMPCTMCDLVIDCHQREDGSGQMYEMVEHFEKVHHQKMCPVCSVLFDTRLPIFKNYFANHIQNHFNSRKYPSPSAPTSE